MLSVIALSAIELCFNFIPSRKATQITTAHVVKALFESVWLYLLPEANSVIVTVIAMDFCCSRYIDLQHDNRQQSNPGKENGRTTTRLSTSFPVSILAPPQVFLLSTGFGLGAVQGGKMAGLRFRAENAHRLPNDTTGWYFYHKAKNYQAMYGGVKEGLKMEPEALVA